MIFDSFNFFLHKVKNVIKNNILLDINETNYIKHNKETWTINQTQTKKSEIILLDLFPSYPLIHFWSYLANILAFKKKAKIKYFYFDTLPKKFTSRSLFLNKLIKIYKSFNVEKGLTSYDFNFSKKKLKKFSENFNRLGNNKKKLNQYSLDGIKIGDLIYDSYLYFTRKPTVSFDDPLLKKIFIEANKIFYSCKDYFEKNKVKAVIPSHICYIPYGIISRIALNNNIKVYKIKSENWGNSFFRLLSVDKKSKIDEHPFYNYHHQFQTFDTNSKKLALKKGKKILENRISGSFDKNLPYMKVSQFKKDNFKINSSRFSSNPKIVIFSHCFYDNPHRFRNLFFNDFFDQIQFIFDLSLKFPNYDWFYKPHPNELAGNLNTHLYLKKKYSHVIFLKKNTGHKSIIKMHPKLVITNHGTISHEYASFNIPVLNTGDNPHINYDFCLHLKNIHELEKILSNLNYCEKKIDFNKNKIYEFLYMHYDYYPNLYNRKKFINDRFFSKKDILENKKSSILTYYIKRHKFDNKKIINYVQNFLDKN